MISCPRCRRPIDETDAYCRHCGRALRPRMGFWYDHGGILLLTLIVGPFSLITVWLSRKLSPAAKWGWTGAIVLFSAYFMYTLYRFFLLIEDTLSYALPSGL